MENQAKFLIVVCRRSGLERVINISTIASISQYGITLNNRNEEYININEEDYEKIKQQLGQLGLIV